jgi:hypothetical protein
MNKLVDRLIKETRDCVNKSKLKEQQQYAESFDEIHTAKDELRKAT